MRDDHHGAFLFGQCADGAEHLPHQLRIQRRGGFIEQDHLRSHRQRTRNGHTLLLSTRQTARIASLFAVQADLLQQRAGACDGLRLRFAFYDHRSFNNVLQHRTVGKQIEVLEDKTDLLTQTTHLLFLFALRQRGIHRNLADPDSAAIRHFQQVNTAQQRGFT